MAGMTVHSVLTIDADPSHPQNVAAYLRTAGDECAFVETNTAHSVPVLLAALAAQGRRPADVRYVIVTHAHLDHAGGAGALMQACPEATLVAHPRAARHLIDPTKLVASATQVYGEERFAALYGGLTPVPETRVRALDDGATLPFGDATLTFLHTRGHAKHHFVVHDPAVDAVFTGDTLGLVYPSLQRAGLFAIASTSPIDFEADEARKSVARILELGAGTAYLTHFGGVHGKASIQAVADRLLLCIDDADGWVKAAAATDAPVAVMKGRIEAEVRAAIERQAASVGLPLTPADWSQLALDVDLNAQGLAFVADRARAERAAH
jgi:glyoxylase-like metal-dependent hydrolase (beta-lactamase superfamily II)